MAKKSSGRSGGSANAKPKAAMSVLEHRKAADLLYAKARIHNAKADLAEAMNPPKKGARTYPC